MSNYLNDENKTNLLFKRFQGVAQTQIAAGATPGKAFYQEATGALKSVFQQDLFAEPVPKDLSFSCAQLHSGVGPAPAASQWDAVSNNVRKQTLGYIDLSATSFPNMSATGQLRFYREVYLEQTPAGQGQSWYLIGDGSAVSIENNVLKDMIPWLYNDTAPQNFRPIVEYWDGNQWKATEQQGDSTGVNWLVDPASGILQFYQPQTVLANNNISAGGIIDGSLSRPRISFIKYVGEKGAGAPSGGGTGSGSGSKITIGVSGETNLTTYQDVSALYFDSTDFSLNLRQGTTDEYVVTQVEKGGFDLSGAFFRIPDAPIIDSSGYFKENNDANIRLKWSKPFQQQSALPFGPTRYYPDGSSVIGTKNIQDLPHFESLRIAYRDLSISGDWVDVSMASNVISDRPIIPVTVNNALFGTLNSTVGDLSNNSASVPPFTAPYTTYWNDSLSSAGNYQFKIWYDNSGTEGFPTSNPYDPGDLSWNYLYIPTSSGEYIVFVGFGPATMPTDLSFQSVFYNSFDISLSNRRAPHQPAQGADASRNTPFPIPSNLSLRYKFGVSISGERDPGSFQDPSSHASQTILGGLPATGIDTSGAFQRFDNVVLDYASYRQDISAAPQTSYTIFNEFGVTNVADFSGFGDFSFNRVFNPVFQTMVTPYPTRSQAISDVIYQKPLVSKILLDGDWNSTVDGQSFNTVLAYETPQQVGSAKKVYFMKDASNARFVTTPGTTFKMANNFATGTDLIGANGQDVSCSAIALGVTSNAPPPINSTTRPTIGYLEDVSTSVVPAAAVHYDFSSVVTEVGKTPGFQNQGYYTGLDVSNVEIKNVQLSTFPDVCNNTYGPYDFSLSQLRNVAPLGWTSDNSAVTWGFYLAKYPEYNTTYAQTYSNSSVTLDNKFFGLMRPAVNAGATIDFSYTVNDIWKWWKKGFNMAYTEMKFEWTAPAALVSSDMSGWPTSISVDSATSGKPLTLPTSFYTGTQKYALVDGSGSWNNSNQQFSITAEVSGNVLFPDLSAVVTSDVSFGTPGKHLWWDYTWAGSNQVPVGIAQVSDFGDCEDHTGTGENLVTPTTFADTSLNYPDNSANFFSTYDHAVSLPFNQLMWCDGGFQSGYTTATQVDLPERLRPYRDFASEFYNPGSVLKDYSALSASGERVNYSLTPGQYYANNSAQDISGVYKWVTVVKNNVTDTDPWNVEVTGSINGGSDTGLTAGNTGNGEYLIFVCEKNILYQTAQGYQYNGRSGWMDGIKKGTATNAAAGSKNGEGAWATVPSGSGSRTGLRIWQASNTNPSDVFFRIGLPCQRTTPTAPDVVKITGISIGKAPLNP